MAAKRTGIDMSKSIITGIVRFFVLSVMLFHDGYSQGVPEEYTRLMFYNVENLFDIDDDTLINDDDFLPRGVMRWSFSRYNRKINSLYKTVVAAGEWNPPAVVAFCEVENKKVIEFLVYETYLSKFNYNIIHEDSPDPRGIDVCLIYRKDLADVIDYNYWVPHSVNNEDFATRSVLYARIKIRTDTIHFIVNHWPSRRGGVMAAEFQRRSIAVMLKSKVDSIYENSKQTAKIIITGDFNCSPDDQVMSLLISGGDTADFLVNLSGIASNEGQGTYRYRGIWEMIDQVIVSDGLLTNREGLYTNEKMFRIFKPDFLLGRDQKYPGMTPLSTYRGYSYQGGYSDHLPVLLDLRFRSQDLQE